MKGFDFDGVVTSGRPGLVPTIDDVIITGNTDVKTVLDWLKTRDIQCAVYFMPKTGIDKNHRYASAVWKSEMVRRLRLDTFYEDDQRTCEILTVSCPDTEVVRIT